MANSEVSGIDLSLKHQWIEQWSSEFSYSFMHAVDQRTQKEIAGRPTHRYSLTNDLTITQPLHLKVVFNIHDGLWHDTNNTLDSDSVIRLHAVLNYQFNEQLQFYVKADNLTEDTHSELSGFNYPRRSFYGGISAKF